MDHWEHLKKGLVKLKIKIIISSHSDGTEQIIRARADASAWAVNR